MQRIDQDAAIRLRRTRNDAQSSGQVGGVGPRHEFEIGGDAVGPQRFAHLRERGGDAGRVGVVNRDQHVRRSQLRAGFKKARKGRHIKHRADAHHFQIEDAHAGGGFRGERFAQQRGVIHQRIGDAAGRSGEHADADAVKAGGGGHVDQLRWRESERGERAEGQDA